MEAYKEQILGLLDKEDSYFYGIIGWVADQYTVGEIMQIPSIRKAIREHFVDEFINEMAGEWEGGSEEDYPFRDKVLALLPPLG